MHFQWPALATSQAREMATDWYVLAIVGALIGALVIALIVYPLVRWRRRPGDALPPQFRRNDKLEIAYTAIPIVIVVALFVLTYRVEADVERVAARPAAVVNVAGFRWSWRFTYPGTAIAIAGTPERPPQMVLPVDETTRVVVTSDDVNHSFWVPDFLFKRDAIPGMRNVFDFHPTRTGTFFGECAEFCGLEHARMSFRVRVVPDDVYARWLRSRGRSFS